MKEDILVSVVVPIYNVEEYLSRCIDSIIRQSYENIEIILVDDGSPDNSGVICDNYAEQDSRITVIHKSNGGLSDARNAGIDISNGEYITFIDSDDFIDEKYIEILLGLCVNNGSDIAQCRFEKGNKDHFVSKQYTNKSVIFDRYEALKTRQTKIIACAKLYKRSLFLKYRFPINKINEDEFTIYKLIYESNKIALTDDVLYYYYDNGQSIMNSKEKMIKLHFIEAYQERLNFFEERQEQELYDITVREFVLRLLLKYIYFYNYKDTRKLLYDYFNKLYKVAIKSRNIALSYKGLFFIFSVSPLLTAKLINIYRKF
jgi:glycosyltransferase involved in cell wall biosynthesis